MAVSVSVGLVLVANDGFRSLYQAQLTDFQKDVQWYLTKDYMATRSKAQLGNACFLGPGQDDLSYFNREVCLNTSEVQPNVLIVGDSFAAQYAPSLRKNRSINVLQTTASGCQPVLPLTGADRCVTLMRYVFEEVLPSIHVDTLIFASRWDDKPPHQVASTIRTLAPSADQIIVVGTAPEYRTDLPRLIAKKFSVMSTPSEMLMATKKHIIAIDETFQSYFDQHQFDDILYVSALQTFCNNGACEVVTDEGTPLAFDFGHLTIEAADRVVGLMPLPENDE